MVLPIQEQHLILKTTTIVAAREQYIADITNWVTESASPPSLMYWMRGPAGVGKSAITRTCTEKLKETGHQGCILLHCNQAHQSLMLIYHHRLPTCDYHPWLSHNYWWEDFEGQDAYWEENSISVQITDCWGDSGVREAGKEGTTKSYLHRWIGRVCRWRCTSRNYRDNCILCQGEMHSIPAPNLASCPFK